MSRHRLTTAVCCVVVALTLGLTALLMSASAALEPDSGVTAMGYEDRLFDGSFVHTIDIQMSESDWANFLTNAVSEEYQFCTLVIDGEAFANVALRAKGNTSLSSVASYGNNRYSLKAEFDQYVAGGSYYGLDKLVLNNNIQDNTLMKDYLTYQMMAAAGAVAPLASYVWVTVNGADWGLYLALEGVEDSFLARNYGNNTGKLYKPDSISMGGGRGNGGDFDMQDFAERNNIELPEDSGDGSAVPPNPSATPDANAQGGTSGNGQEGFPGGGNFPQGTFQPGEGNFPGGQGGGQEGFPGGQGGFPNMGGENAFGGMSASDVSLVYTDDDPASYPNIFDSAKTAVSRADKLRLIASLKRLNAGEDIANTVDVEAVICYFVAHNFTVNFDSYTGSMIHNYYLYEQNSLLSMIPWDYNLAFGGFQSAGDATALVNYPIDTPVSGGTVDSRPMLAWIFASEEYTALYHECFAQFIESFFDNGEFETLFDATVAMLSPYVERDANGFCTYDEFLKGTAALREFCLLRARSISGQLEGSVPATSEGQEADSSALVDASGLSIADMGSMMGGGFGRGQGELKIDNGQSRE